MNLFSICFVKRWLAYADRRLVSWWRSQGGCEGDGAQSYTATVLHAAKSLGKGLRDLSGSVASSLTGTGMPNNMMNGGELSTPGIVTVLDIEVRYISFYFIFLITL